MTCLEFAQLMSNVLVGLSAIVVAIVAIVGLGQWKAEMKGKSRLELAKRMSVLAREWGDKYQDARSPFTFAGESADRPAGENETRDETFARNEEFAKRRRIIALEGTLGALKEIAREAEVVFDESIAPLLEPIVVLSRELYVAHDTHFSYRIERAMHDAEADARDELMRQSQGVIYGFKDDELSKKANAAVSALVAKLKAISK